MNRYALAHGGGAALLAAAMMAGRDDPRMELVRIEDEETPDRGVYPSSEQMARMEERRADEAMARAEAKRERKRQKRLREQRRRKG